MTALLVERLIILYLAGMFASKKRVALTLVASCAVCVALFFGCVRFINSGWLGQFLADHARQKYSISLKFGNPPRIVLFPLAIAFDRLEWSDRARAVPYSFSVASGRILLNTYGLFNGKIEAREVLLNKPVLLADISAQNSSISESLANGASNTKRFFQEYLEKIVFLHGSLVIHSKDERLALREINLSVENLRPRQDANVKCDFAIRSRSKTDGETESGENSQDELIGNLALSARLRYYEPNLTFREASATFTALGANDLKRFSPLQIQADGSVNLEDLRFRLSKCLAFFPHGSANLSGSGAIRDVSFTGAVSLEIGPDSIQFGVSGKNNLDAIARFDSELRIDGKKIRLPDAKFNWGNTKASADLTITEWRLSSPEISGIAKFGIIDLDEAISRLPPRKSAIAASQSRENFRAVFLPSLNLRASADEVRLDRLRLTGLSFLVRGEDGKYDVEDIAFKWENGDCAGKISLDCERDSYDVSLTGRNVSFGAILERLGIADAYGGPSDFSINLRANGPNLPSLASALTGSGYFACRDLKFQPLSDLAAFLPFFAGPDFVMPNGLQNIDAKFAADRGIVEFFPVVAAGAGIEVRSRATLNLPLNLISGKILLKLGRLDLPLSFEGSPRDIRWGIDFPPARIK